MGVRSLALQLGPAQPIGFLNRSRKHIIDLASNAFEKGGFRKRKKKVGWLIGFKKLLQGFYSHRKSLLLFYCNTATTLLLLVFYGPERFELVWPGFS